MTGIDLARQIAGYLGAVCLALLAALLAWNFIFTHADDVIELALILMETR